MESLSEESRAVADVYETLSRANLSVAFTKKVLVRPPFPFLHKLCAEAFGRAGIFTSVQLSLGNLITRDQKAGFLVRALAFVAFTLRAAGVDCVSVLLFVSPVQVLAGLEVDRTHEFLRQVVLVHQLHADGVKATAAAEVQQKGESQLYTMAMKFRRGLTKVQAAVRLFLANKAATAADNNADVTPPVPGTKFLKEFDGFGTFEGVVRSATNGVYVVYYAQDGDEEELDEDEMLEVLRQSRLLEVAAKASVATAPPSVAKAAMPDPPLPMAFAVNMEPVNLFGDLERDLPSRQQRGKAPSTKASDASGRPADVDPTQVEFVQQRDGLASRGTRRQLSEASLGDSSDPMKTFPPRPTTPANSSPNEAPKRQGGEPLWRQKLLALVNSNGIAVVPSPTTLQQGGANPMGLAPPTLPRIAVPGGAAKWSKRLKQPKDIAFRDSIHGTKPKASAVSANQRASPPKPKDASSRTSVSIKPQQPDASLFESSYSLSDERTHQTVVMRAVVKRIDKYLRRKRMRVIDLFRYCDFDHCGYITPGGMEEVLRQMDIRLPPAEMEMFMMHLDTNKNGVIDVDEFESLVRVHRRTDARRDQLRQELPHVLKLDPVSASPAHPHASSVVPASLVALKDQILHAAHALDLDAAGTVSAAALAKAIGGLTVPKIPSDTVDMFVAICRPLHGLVFVSDIERVLAGPAAKGRAKDNRFLDHTWLGQFDAQMEKVRGLGG